MGKIIKANSNSSISRVNNINKLTSKKNITPTTKADDVKEVKLTVQDYVDNATHIGKTAQEEVEKKNIQKAKEDLAKGLSKEEFRKTQESKQDLKKINNNPKVLTQIDEDAEDKLEDDNLTPEQKMALLYNQAQASGTAPPVPPPPFSNVGSSSQSSRDGNNTAHLDPIDLKRMSQEEADMMKWKENQEMLRQLASLQMEERLEQMKHYQRMWAMMRAGERYRRQIGMQVLMNEAKTEIDLYNQMWEVV